MQGKYDIWRSIKAPFVRRPPEYDAGDEKRMVIILLEGAYEDWLTALAAATRNFLLPYPAGRLVSVPQPK